MNVALFDLDHTLLPLDSDYAWGEFTLELGWVDPVQFKQRNDAFFAQYQAGQLHVHDYVRFATQALRERSLHDAHKAHTQFMDAIIRPQIQPAALDLLAHHRRRGDAIAIVTATNAFVTGPIAQALGVETLIAIELERDPQGRYTGEIAGVPSFREGKVARVAEWMAQHGWQWTSVHTTFYSDSTNDLPLLERVDEPVATNPSDSLRAVAQARGWRVLDLFTH